MSNFNTFLSFKGSTQAYLLKNISNPHKNRNPLLNLLNNCKSAKSGIEILSIKDEFTFRFLTFLIFGLCNSLANFLLSQLIPVPLFVSEDFFSKYL